MIRPLQSPDIPALFAIQSASPEAAQWSQSNYESIEQKGMQVWVAEIDGRMRGFLVGRRMANEMEILNLAVDPSARRRGIGRQLIRAAFEWARENSVTKIHLEVRKKNQDARKFYEANGFHRAGIRPNYYHEPSDDAILLTCGIAF